MKSNDVPTLIAVNCYNWDLGHNNKLTKLNEIKTLL